MPTLPTTTTEQRFKVLQTFTAAKQLLSTGCTIYKVYSETSNKLLRLQQKQESYKQKAQWYTLLTDAIGYAYKELPPNFRDCVVVKSALWAIPELKERNKIIRVVESNRKHWKGKWAQNT